MFVFKTFADENFGGVFPSQQQVLNVVSWYYSSQVTNISALCSKAQHNHQLDKTMLSWPYFYNLITFYAQNIKKCTDKYLQEFGVMFLLKMFCKSC